MTTYLHISREKGPPTRNPRQQSCIERFASSEAPKQKGWSHEVLPTVCPNVPIPLSPPCRARNGTKQAARSGPCCTPRLTFWICCALGWVIWVFAIAVRSQAKAQQDTMVAFVSCPHVLPTSFCGKAVLRVVVDFVSDLVEPS